MFTPLQCLTSVWLRLGKYSPKDRNTAAECSLVNSEGFQHQNEIPTGLRNKLGKRSSLPRLDDRRRADIPNPVNQRNRYYLRLRAAPGA